MKKAATVLSVSFLGLLFSCKVLREASYLSDGCLITTVT